jgi:hypothetical protein
LKVNFSRAQVSAAGLVTLPLYDEFGFCSKYVNSQSARALLQSTAQRQTYIQHSSKPRSDEGRRKKFKIGNSWAALIF